MKKKEDIQEYLKQIKQEEKFVSPEVLECLPFSNSGKNTWVEIENPEFTSICPKTGLPDYGSVTIKYLPDKYIVELKSLKFYFLQFRNTGIYYENLTKLILNHLVDALHPVEMSVTAEFTPRGGMVTRVTSNFKK